MSTPETEVKRRPGRPRKNPVETAATTSVVHAAPEPAAAVTIPDDELEQYGGDVAALESWSPRSGKPFARRGDFGPMLNILPDLSFKGTLVYRHNPSAEFNFAWLEEDGSNFSRQTAFVMRQKRYSTAMAEDFVVAPELRETIVRDSTGRLTLSDPSGKSAAVVMFRSKADYQRDRKLILQQSDSIQMTAEEKAAKTQENLRRQGMSGVVAKTEMVDDYS